MKEFNSVCVAGAGASGSAVVQLAKKLGKKIYLTDAGYPDIDDPDIEVELGGHSREFISRADCVVVSPGIITEEFRRKYVSGDQIFTGEIEFAYWYCKSEDIVAVTGTNGKTTTTHICAGVLEKYSGRKVFCGGNIGRPFASFVLDVNTGDIVVLELSSFQLETIDSFHPRAAAILNLRPDHLDRYACVEDYYAEKKRLFMNMTASDTLLYPQDVPNAEFVKQLVSVYGVSSQQVDEYMSAFGGLPHRLETVGEYEGVLYINDSKATNVDAAIWALKNIRGRIILLAGGKDKGIDYKGILPYAAHVKSVVVFGAAAERIADDLKDSLDVIRTGNIHDALIAARDRAEAGDRVVLSPMCASFDQFKNYMERGDVFREAVHKLYS